MQVIWSVPARIVSEPVKQVRAQRVQIKQGLARIATERKETIRLKGEKWREELTADEQHGLALAEKVRVELIDFETKANRLEELASHINSESVAKEVEHLSQWLGTAVPALGTLLDQYEALIGMTLNKTNCKAYIKRFTKLVGGDKPEPPTAANVGLAELRKTIVEQLNKIEQQRTRLLKNLSKIAKDRRSEIKGGDNNWLDELTNKEQRCLDLWTQIRNMPEYIRKSQGPLNTIARLQRELDEFAQLIRPTLRKTRNKSFIRTFSELFSRPALQNLIEDTSWIKVIPSSPRGRNPSLALQSVRKLKVMFQALQRQD